MEERAGDYSTLQHVLQLSYSQDPEDQQKAAIELSKLVNGAVFPAYSFGPLSNAITVLLPSSNRTVVSYSARALKIMLLDDALRPQTIIAGVPAAVCTAIKQWEDEILCLRELLGALQTLCWDKQCVKGVLQADIIGNLIEYITVGSPVRLDAHTTAVTHCSPSSQASDQEVSVLALATLSNILSYSDTLLLADITTVESLGKGMPALLDALKASSQKPQRLYAAAAIANASFHPRLVAVLNEHGGMSGGMRCVGGGLVFLAEFTTLSDDCGVHTWVEFPQSL